MGAATIVRRGLAVAAAAAAAAALAGAARAPEAGAGTCTPGTAGCAGPATSIQGDWGTSTTTAGALLTQHYAGVYGSTFGIVEVGLPGASGRSMSFTSAGNVLAYLPSSGGPGPLNADLVDPVTSSSGVFGGEVLALRLNVDFADAGLLGAESGPRFGDLTVCRAPVGPSGISVRAFLALAQNALGGGPSPYALDGLNTLAQDLNASFVDGVASAFAEAHLFPGPCPPPPDTTAPACAVAARGRDADGRAFIRFVVTDAGSGLDRHEVVLARNADVAVDAYAAGAPGPVSVVGTAIDPARSLSVTVDFHDRAGNRATCDPIVYAVARVDDQPQDETFTGVPAAESRVTIENGDPGMRKVLVTVNGKRFKETSLRPGEVRTFDVASAMRPGDHNTVVVRARGKRGASALIVLADIE
jgi:hypothetical protein